VNRKKKIKSGRKICCRKGKKQRGDVQVEKKGLREQKRTWLQGEVWGPFNKTEVKTLPTNIIKFFAKESGWGDYFGKNVEGREAYRTHKKKGHETE